MCFVLVVLFCFLGRGDFQKSSVLYLLLIWCHSCCMEAEKMEGDKIRERWNLPCSLYYRPTGHIYWMEGILRMCPLRWEANIFFFKYDHMRLCHQIFDVQLCIQVSTQCAIPYFLILKGHHLPTKWQKQTSEFLFDKDSVIQKYFDLWEF